MNRSSWKLNTSNPGKFAEFKRLFAQHNCQIQTTHVDLKEIDADPLTVAVHKASQVEERTLIEDSSLEIDGASVGAHIRWLLDHLHDYVGRKATWIVFLAYCENSQVFVYRGLVAGTLVEPRGTGGFGFDPFFLPDGAIETLAQAKPDVFNARGKAVESLLTGIPWAIRPVLRHWEGSWQDEGQT